MKDPVPVYNTTAEVIPGFALMRREALGVNADGQLRVAKPDTDGQLCIVNGPVAIPPAKIGQGTWERRVFLAYDPQDDKPVPGDTWGATKDSWLARKNRPGFVIDGGAGGGVVNAVRYDLTITSWKNVVRAATTTNVTLSSVVTGSSLDSVTLAKGDRILIKDQTDGSQNGIRIVQDSGIPPRAIDASTGDELVGATVYVSEGTLNGDSIWACTTNAVITINVTATVWVKVWRPAREAYLTTGNGASPEKWKFIPLTMVAGVETVGTETTDYCAISYSIDGVNTCIPVKCLRVQVWDTGEIIAGVRQFTFRASPRGVPVELTSSYGGDSTGYAWKLLIATLGNTPPFGGYSPPLTGANAFTVDDNQSLLSGRRGTLFPTPTTNGSSCSVSKGWIFTPSGVAASAGGAYCAENTFTSATGTVVHVLGCHTFSPGKYFIFGKATGDAGASDPTQDWTANLSLCLSTSSVGCDFFSGTAGVGSDPRWLVGAGKVDPVSGYMAVAGISGSSVVFQAAEFTVPTKVYLLAVRGSGVDTNAVYSVQLGTISSLELGAVIPTYPVCDECGSTGSSGSSGSGGGGNCGSTTITTTALGTASGTGTTSATATIAGVTLPKCCQLVVYAGFNSAGGSPTTTGVTFAGNAMSFQLAAGFGNERGALWLQTYYNAATDVTGDIVCTVTGGTTGTTVLLTASYQTALTPAFDKQSHSHNISSAPNSGATGTTSTAATYVSSAAFMSGSTVGTWGGGFAALQTVTAGGYTLNEGGQIPGATGSFTASLSGVTPSDWSCVAWAFK